MSNLYSKNIYKLLYYFYPLLCILCVFQLRGIIHPYYPATGVFSWPFRLLIIFLGGKAFLAYYKKSSLISAFFLYSVFTVVCYLFNDRPFSLYFIELISYVTPMLFAFIALDNNDFSNKFYKYFLYAIIVCFVFGFYLHFIRPEWYKTALTATYNDRWYTNTNYDYESVANQFRYSSIFITSYAVSHFSMFALPISIAYLIRENKTRYMIFAAISLIAAIICLHRVAIVSCLLILFLYIFYDSRHAGKLKSLTFLVIAIVILAIVYLSTSDLFSQVLERFDQINISDAFDESRTSQNKNVFNIWQNYILGDGIGAVSADARKIGYSGITDGNYMKILVEEGVIGFLLYTTLIAKTLLRGWRFFKYLSIEFSIVLSISIAMIGSNSLVMPFYILPYWYAIGRIWNKDYLNHLFETNNHI